jgi:C4-dicarboxylate-specific signal transduction histidine kinase
LTEIRKWLGEFGGVHLYHRGMRVSPYSDFDWLDMNLRRSQLQELRPSTNTSIGRMFVKDPEGRLKPKTDRVGFIEDETFQELRRFGTDALEWLASQRLKQREARRDTEKGKTARRIQRAKKNLQQAVDSVPPAVRQEVEEAVENLERAKDREVHGLREDLQLYRTLCTVGTTTAAFAHQAKSPLGQITSSAGILEDAFRSQIKAAHLPMLREMAVDIRRFAESLLSFSKVTLCLLQHEKRRRTAVSIHEAIEDVLGLIKPYLDLRDVRVRRELRAQRCSLLASQAALESILTNLLINSLQAFEQNHPGERLVMFQTDNLSDPHRPSKSLVRLVVSDNGPGIKKLNVEDVWLPGKTTTVEGTGLGLTIVKDVVTELGGSVTAIAQGELGGAEFQIDLPTRGG